MDRSMKVFLNDWGKLVGDQPEFQENQEKTILSMQPIK